MKFALRFCGLIVLSVWLPAAVAQFLPLKVVKVEIQHIGPVTVSDDLIRANIRVKPGDPYRAGAVDDDVRGLYATGLFYNIRVTDETTPEGVVLTYVVEGKPKLTEIRFHGNTKYTDAKLRKKLASKVGEPLDERKLFTDAQEIQKRYQKAGYPGTQVKYVPAIDENAGRASVTFEITESPKIRIQDVEFVGAKAFSQKKLRWAIKTRRHWMFSWITGSGVFKDEQFEDDREKLTDFYRSRGYIDFEIKDVQFEHPTPKTEVIRFILYEGRRYKVGSAKFTGNKLFSAAQIAAGMRALQPPGAVGKKAKLGPNGLKMDVGDVFTPQGLHDDEKQVEDFYGMRGYVDVRPPRTLEVVRIPNTETGTMDLEFKIDEGQKSYIEKIDIRGNTKTKDRVIRRELAVSPGEVFDMVRVNLSKQRLEGLQYFEKVDARPEATDVLYHKNLIINVEEKNTGNLTVGAGFSSVDALVGFAEVSQGNFDLFHPPWFTGGGQKIRLRAQLGTERQDYELEFMEPWFLQRKLMLDVNLFYRDLDFLSINDLYREVDAGVRVSLTRALGSDFLRGTVGYSLEDIGIIFNQQQVSPSTSTAEMGQVLPGVPPPVPDALLEQSGYSLVSKIFGSLICDTRGPGFLPEKGQLSTLTAEMAGPFGGSKDYYKLELKTHWHFKGLFPGHVLELLGGTGVADTYDSTASVPFYDRFYLGGLFSLRGFRYHDISPRETDPRLMVQSDEPIGGDTYWFASAEYTIPIIDRLRFAIFYDIGEVRLQPYAFDASDFSDNWGLGLRLNLPIGPLLLYYGIPIHHDIYNSSSGQFQFGVSYTRPF
jgi:outer membrane protein insertion porin family